MKNIAIVLCSILIYASSLPAQTTIGFYGGPSSCNGPARFTKSISEGGFGIGAGYNISGQIKLAISGFPVKIPLRITTLSFYGKEETVLQYRGPVGIHSSGSLVALSGGVEYYLPVSAPVNPYIGAAINVNYISVVADYDITDYGRAGGSSSDNIGLELSAGAEFIPYNSVGFELRLNYGMYAALIPYYYASDNGPENNLSDFSVSLGVLFPLNTEEKH